MKKIFLILLTLSLLSLNMNAQGPTSMGKAGIIDASKIYTNVFAEFSMLEVEFYKNGEGEMSNKNISSAILGFSSTLTLNKSFDLIGSLGVSEGFNYNFASTNLALKLSKNLGLHYGIGLYNINDDRWVPQGLDGNEPSKIDFGMNFGINLQLTNLLGLTMKYNLIEEKEEGLGSMSIGGLSFGIIIK